MIAWDEQKVLSNVRRADTDDLLDRITVYRQGMEAMAIAMIENELQSRGITAAAIAAHEEKYRRECLFESDGTSKMCSSCRKPAVAEGWGWHKLWRTVPVFPRRFRFCKDHRPMDSNGN